MIRAEFQNLRGWQAHHHRLVARLLLILVGTVIADAAGTILIYMTERHARGTDIHTLGDALLLHDRAAADGLVADHGIRSRRWAAIVDIVLEIWAVLVVAGSAGAIAAFLQDADRPR